MSTTDVPPPPNRTDETVRLFLQLVHDLKGPLTAAHLNIELALAAQREATATLEEGEAAMRRALAMVSNIVCVVAGKASTVRTPVDITQLASGLRREMRAQFALEGLRLEVQVERGASMVLGDPDELRRALWNLLDNAARHAPHGSAVRLCVRPQRNIVEVRVEDHGIGVEAARRTEIFSAYAESGETRGRLNWGIGLSSTYQIVTRHGGSIFVEDNVPSGAVFVIHLPTLPGATF